MSQVLERGGLNTPHSVLLTSLTSRFAVGPCRLSGLVRSRELVSLIGLGVNSGFLALLGRDRGGRLGQRVEAAT